MSIPKQQPKIATPEPMTDLDHFRNSLKDVEAFCSTMYLQGVTDVDDLVGMAQLGIKNDGQLSMLFHICGGQ